MRKVFFILLLVLYSLAVFAQGVPKPTRNQIAKDLVGHKLSEGYDNGWFDGRGWIWKIEKGEIEALKIVQELRNTNREYCIVVLMRLRDDYKAFNAKVKISYILSKENHWKMEYVSSLGMDYVNTNKYNDCLSYEIVPECMLFPPRLLVTNKSDIRLGCAVYLLVEGQWKKAYGVIDPHSSEYVCVNGGIACTESVSRYKVAFIMNEEN